MYKNLTNKKEINCMKNIKRVIKLSYPFERIKNFNEIAEIALFKSVITQMIIDATNTSDVPRLKRLELKAKKWLFGNSDDFRMVCSMASLSHSYVYKIAREVVCTKGREGNILFNVFEKSKFYQKK